MKNKDTEALGMRGISGEGKERASKNAMPAMICPRASLGEPNLHRGRDTVTILQ